MPGSSTTGPMTTTTTGGSSSTGESPADSTGGGMGCCERHSSPGCEEQAVTECVCTLRAECCAFGWGQRCVDLATSECGATCMPDGGNTTGLVEPTTGTGVGSGDSSDSGGPLSACCKATKTPGCVADMMIEQCVCAQDPFCCEQQWDGKCVGVAMGACGVECGGGGGDGGGEADCCMPHQRPGCEDRMTEQCVCGQDPFCCDQMWDDQCVQTAAQACMAC